MIYYNRILLKLSGEALMGKREFGIDPEILKSYAEQIADIHKLGVQIGIVVGGGNIFRGVQAAAQVIIKGTRVDGIYDSDPEKNPNAVKFDHLTYQEVIAKDLRVMDQTAITLCKENKLPILVFDINKPNNLKRIIHGEKIGTIVK